MGSLLALLIGAAPKVLDLIAQHQAAESDNERAVIQGRIEATKAAYALAATAAGQVIVLIFAAIAAFHFGKCVIWDNDLGYYTHGTTPPLNGDVADTMKTVIWFVFGHGIATIGHGIITRLTK